MLALVGLAALSVDTEHLALARPGLHTLKTKIIAITSSDLFS
jgi:hypothetical protein